MTIAKSVKGTRFAALLAVVGPGLLAGLSDDDPAGITTYSVLGADHGYQLLWVLLFSTVALVVFHGLAARMGVVTGQGLIGLVRQRYGVRIGGAVLAALVVANIGTTTAEFAGIAAGFGVFGVSRHVSVPIAAVIVSLLVLRGSFHRVERLLLLLSTVATGAKGEVLPDKALFFGCRLNNLCVRVTNLQPHFMSVGLL